MHSCTFAIAHKCSLHTCAPSKYCLAVMRFASIRAMDIDLHADLLRAVKQGEGTAAVHFCRRYYNGRDGALEVVGNARMVWEVSGTH